VQTRLRHVDRQRRRAWIERRRQVELRGAVLEDPAHVRVAVAREVGELLAQVAAAVAQCGEQPRHTVLAALGRRRVEPLKPRALAVHREDRVVRRTVDVQQPAQLRRQGDPAARRRPRVRPGSRLAQARRHEIVRVAPAQRAQPGVGARIRTRAVRAQVAGLLGIEAAEVKEAQARAAGEQAVLVLGQRTLGEVPVRDVAAAIGEQADAAEHARDEVEPVLVDEQAVGDVDPAATLQALRPPLQKARALVAAAHRDEAGVVGAGLHHVGLRRRLPVERHGVEEVRREHDLVRLERLGDRLERRGHEDVGIEVHDALVVFEFMRQQSRLQRHRELERLVAQREAPQLVARDVVRGQDVERLVRRIEALVGLVDDEHRDALGMMRGPRRGEHPRPGQPILRDDRAQPHRP
jgi:hypothetical protein